MKVLSYLHYLISYNVIGNKQYESRYKGFVGELEFNRWFSVYRANTRTFSGGYLIPQSKGTDTLDSPVYFTITQDNHDNYIDVYSTISRLKCKELYFVRWIKDDPDKWEKKDIMKVGMELPIPKFEFYKFHETNKQFQSSSLEELLANFPPSNSVRRSVVEEELGRYFADRLSEFQNDILLDLYVQRLFFDGFIGFDREKGIPSDIDFILFSEKNNQFQFLEVKEKDLSKREPVGFGMDLRRIENLTRMSRITGVPIYYVVRRVNNQTERNFVEWLIIDILDFEKNLAEEVIQGGTGMRAENSDNPTRICPVEHFKLLSKKR